MGHSTFAYLTTYDGTANGLSAAYLALHEMPRADGPNAFTDEGNYTIRDRAQHHVLPRPRDLTASDLERIARAIIRNCRASRDHAEAAFAEGTVPGRYTWDDPQAREFLFRHAGKWLPGVAMPIDERRCFVFGMAGG